MGSKCSVQLRASHWLLAPAGPTRLLTGSARMTDVANRALAGTVVSMLQINNLN